MKAIEKIKSAMHKFLRFPTLFVQFYLAGLNSYNILIMWPQQGSVS